nr:AAA family ATPase [Clostridium sp. Marseille-P7770]
MGMFLNSRVPYDAYQVAAAGKYFMDKTALLQELFLSMNTTERFLCITRPRRFGKSVMANMVGAFFGKAEDSRQIFSQLEIATDPYFERHLNRHNIIYIDFSKVPEKCTTYDAYITRILDGLKKDLFQEYPDLQIDTEKAVWDILNMICQEKNEKYIFVIDEWDAPFHMDFITEQDQKEYLLFLKSLLKGEVYVELAYMTGVLPIAKYSSGSELNMFLEYDMATSVRFSEFFGFLDSEVDTLYQRYRTITRNPKIAREDLKNWYDGYHTAGGDLIYNPRSIVCALTDNQVRNYWTSSGPYDEIFYYVRNNVEEVRDDIVLMIAGEGIDVEIQNYAATAMKLHTKDEIYSAMVIYGLLTYEDGKVFIPNREIMDQFRLLLMSKESFGYVYNLARESEKMLKATIAGDTNTMSQILKYAHDSESPIFSYNNEIELSAVVNLVYLAARDRYQVEREEKAGEGYADFIFYPERKNADALILELKVDASPEEAIAQIKKKNYALRLMGKLGEKQKYTGRILAVGISYDRKTKEHFCRVEELKNG